MPNVCKMPGPPAPFVPTPLPNIGTSDDSPEGYSTTVKIEGQPVAIQGASFKSKGDIASQGTGGGLISNNVQGATKFVAPGSLNVKIEGKNTQYLGDQMTNNNGPSGSPPNSATMTGVVHSPGGPTVIKLKCGDCDSYKELKKKKAKPKFERDHIPSKAALRDAAKNRHLPDTLSKKQLKCVAKKVEAGGITVAIPKMSHRKFSPTCGSRNTKAQLAKDAKSPKSMREAVDRDLAAMKKHLKGTDCEKAYNDAAKKIKAHDNEALIDKALKECTT
jgi:uncharacterized Zn-binding protein involved in type VI secretion